MNRSLHVAFFNRSYHPDLSATGQLLTELCEELRRRHGCRVSVVAGMPLRPVDPESEAMHRTRGLVQRESRRGVEIFRARGTRFSKKRFIGRFSNYVSYFLSACCAGQKLDCPDIVVALTDPPIIGLAAWAAAKRFRSPFVMAYKDIFPEVAHLLEDFDSRLVETVLQTVNRFLARNADAVVALGETMRRRLIEGKGADPERTVVIPDWTDCRQIRPFVRRNAFAVEHGLSEKFVIMHSGNIGLSQGLEKIVPHLARRLSNVPEIRLVLVGEGVKRCEIEAAAARENLSNLQFLPFQPKERLIESFASADVFLISLKRGLSGYIVPSKLYGILAAGRPFVAAVEPDCEVAQLAREYGCGLPAKAEDPDSVAEQILKLYRERSLLEEMCERARQAALRFDRPRSVDSYFRLFAGLRVSRAEMRPALSKRLLDVFLAALGIIFSAPLWGLIAGLVKLEDGGPVFHFQHRVGRGGRLFRSWKFRSMVVEADRLSGPRQAVENDSRVTRVGRVLRATALDELPQLWNILKGEMSFVGPRALLPAEIEVRSAGDAVRLHEIPGYRERHRVTPGLTGIAQVYAPRDVPRRQKFRLDLLYIQKWSFFLDLKLILLSFWITFRGRWETRGNKLW